MDSSVVRVGTVAGLTGDTAADPPALNIPVTF
jgi:hypothetical protein